MGKYIRNEYWRLTDERRAELSKQIYELYINQCHNVEEVRVILGITRNTTNRLIDDLGIRKTKEQVEKEKVEKFHNTCIEKFGETCPAKNKNVKEKLKKTNLERYGCECVLQNSEVRNKIKETTLLKYGCENSMQSEIVKAKSRATCREHYGVDYYVQTKESQDHIQEVLSNKYGVASIAQLNKPSESVKILNDKDLFVEFLLSIPENERDKNNICELLNIGKAQLNWRFSKWDLKDLIPFSPRTRSKAEVEIVDFIRSLGIKCLISYRKLIKNPETNTPLEIDIFIPSHNLGIEFNGIYWHDKLNPIMEERKTKLCEEKGVKLIHIWEDDWNRDKESILNNLKFELLNYSVIESIEVLDVEDTDVYDIEVPEYNNFTLANDLVVHNSRDTLQQLSQAGFDTQLVSLDKTADGYLYLRASLNEKRIALLEIPELEKELVNLERNNLTGKVDHPVNGSKDISDSLTGALYSASMNTDISTMYVVEDHTAVSEVNEDSLSSDIKTNVINNLTKSIAEDTMSLSDRINNAMSIVNREREEELNKRNKRIQDMRSKMTASESHSITDDELEDAMFNRMNDDILIF